MFRGEARETKDKPAVLSHQFNLQQRYMFSISKSLFITCYSPWISSTE